VLGDWDHPYLTLDREYEADELRLFADIVEKGFVYRGKKPVYWSIPARTALAAGGRFLPTDPAHG
jgi:isoleucyl-tRNA synthetase